MEMNVTSPKVVKALMNKYCIAPLKKYGQNFLIDGNIADKIASAAMPDNACVLEIGPGLGALTSRLIKKAKAVVAYEIDAGLVEALKYTLSDAWNLTIFHQDFLKADLEQNLNPLFNGADLYVAANLPFYITSSSIMKLISSNLNIKRITVMVQKEVAERICAVPGTRHYSAITAAVAFFATPEKLFNVSHSCFYPQPNVLSTVLMLKMHAHDREEARAYLNTVKGLFAMRRKTIKSNLRQSFGLDIKEVDAVLKNAGIDENARAETLSVKDYLKITQELRILKKIFHKIKGKTDFI
ncbi:MAG: 16S rRNA (adenine(1518)-N(6)/adenine(1519)-N(6))-dimethyltransferase RsmA [Christensenellales bacterium]|jgi:16S rRNA (adenine1518-N6/adenine1519-N6)-dimethyltransferase